MHKSLPFLSLAIACTGDVSVIEKPDTIINDSGCESLVWYPDSDGDGFGGIDAVSSCDQPSGYVANNDDCNDEDASVYPDAPELCNSLDDDCDSEIDEDVSDLLTWYTDADNDGFGDPNSPMQACEQPSGTVDNADDCNDNNDNVNPLAVEICNGLDDDCDTLIDDEAIDPLTWYEDSDTDTYGDPDSSLESCDQPNGYVSNSDDCDDTDAGLNLSCTPTATTTTCNGQTYTATGPNSSQPELHVLSAYEPAGSSIAVHIGRTTQMTVLLSSYEPVNWVVTVDPGATVDKILVNGYHSQSISLPNGIPYEIRSYDQTVSNFGNWCGYSLPYNGGGCDTNLLLQGVQSQTGLGWTSFTGCYTASEFLLQ